MIIGTTKAFIVSLACGVLLAATIARAQTVTMDYLGPDSSNSGGYYTYPYYFSINGGFQVSLLCTTFSNGISPGDQWTATTLSVANLTSAQGLEFPNAGVTGYLEACYLYELEVSAYAANTDPEGLYNWAVWDLLSGTDVSAAHLSGGDETTVQGYLATAAAQSLTPSQFSDVVIFTPTDTSAGGPQEFMGVVVPEPGTLALVGLGVAGLVLIRKRK